MEAAFDQAIAHLGPYDHYTIISGNCPDGGDQLCEDVARHRGLGLELHPANWEKLGKRAGFVRNAEMVALGADICLAFIHNQSRGASMTAGLAEKAGIETWRYSF